MEQTNNTSDLSWNLFDRKIVISEFYLVNVDLMFDWIEEKSIYLNVVPKLINAIELFFTRWQKRWHEDFLVKWKINVYDLL